MNHRNPIALVLLALCLCLQPVSCGSSPGPDGGETQWSVLSVSLLDFPEADIVIDNPGRSVSVTLPYGSTLGQSRFQISLPEGLASEPTDGAMVDLRDFKAIYLSDPTGAAAKFSVTVMVKPSSSTAMRSVTASRYLVTAPASDKMHFTLPWGADLTNIVFSVDTDEALSFEPDITAGIDLSSPGEVRVTAADGVTSRTVTLEASLYPKDRGVRGVYLPSPTHSSSFTTYSQICRSLDLMRELGFNCLFVCSWAATRTCWDSDVLKRESSWDSARSGNMYRGYSDGSGDALADIISEAHKRDIKVVLWFEYGFMHAAGGVNYNDPLLLKHPDWLGVNDSGTPCNYNGNDWYLNGYDPAVQEFILDLMKEAVQKYPDVDGVQGDDRLPAMPRNAGYDAATLAAYKAETGREPAGINDEAWVRWRLDRLNAFASRMHSELKAIKPSLIVCFAPNKYPWCESVLMQDWPSWISDGAVDLLTVQCYVTATYDTDVAETMYYVREKTSADIFNPAMILKNGDALMSPAMLARQLGRNRETGTFGESQFWFDGLWNSDIQEVFKAWYSYPVAFPEL